MSVITMIPEQASGNAYTTLLYRALERQQVRYVQIPYSLPYLLGHRPLERFHYLHFHWPEIFLGWRWREPHKLFGARSVLRLYGFWMGAKLRGYRIVWILHEVEVHDVKTGRWVHSLSRRHLWRLADMVFVHSESVRREAERRWGVRPRVHVVPHGSYVGAYPAALSRETARARLEIPLDAYVFAFLGSVRPYKGVDILIDAFRALQADHPRAHLVIAGRPLDAAYEREIRAAAAGIPHLHLALGFVPDGEVQLYLRAADCFVAPYRHVETCGAIYLALAFDLPVIIKSEGNVSDFESLDIGILMRDATDTEAAMRRMLAQPPEERARQHEAVRAAAALNSWEALAPRYRAAFEAFEEGRAGRQ